MYFGFAIQIAVDENYQNNYNFKIRNFVFFCENETMKTNFLVHHNLKKISIESIKYLF